MHVIVEHRIGRHRPPETSSADESHAVQPLASINTQNPLALRRLLEFAVPAREASLGGSYGTLSRIEADRPSAPRTRFRLWSSSTRVR
jgi:hypothetical protein